MVLKSILKSLDHPLFTLHSAVSKETLNVGFFKNIVIKI